MLFPVSLFISQLQASFDYFSIKSKGKEEERVKAQHIYVVYHTKNAFVPDLEAQTAEVKNISLHPKFYPKHVKHDISILSLSKELVLTSGLDIKLPNVAPAMDKDCIFSGFGKLYDVRSALVLNTFQTSLSEGTFGWNHGNS